MSCHHDCQFETKEWLKAGGIVIVSNTNIKLEDMKIYRDICHGVFSSQSCDIETVTGDYGSLYWGTGFDQRLMILEPPTPWKYNIDECMKKCIHSSIERPYYATCLKGLQAHPTDDQLIQKLWF